MGTSTCGELEAAFQTVELGIAYTKGIVIDDDCEAVVMPSFAYGEAFSRLSAVIAHEAGTVQHRKETGEDDALDLLIPRPSSVVRDNENPSAHNKQTRNVNKRPLKYGKDNSKGDTVGLAANTQDKEDLARLKVLVTLPASPSRYIPLTEHSKQQSHIKRTIPSQLRGSLNG